MQLIKSDLYYTAPVSAHKLIVNMLLKLALECLVDSHTSDINDVSGFYGTFANMFPF
jgi:hypothetical protein